MHMTSLCPDKCGHGGAVAVFKVLGYTNYEKPGKYGDEKQQRFHVKLAGIGAEKNADVVAKIKALKPNDKVVLDWNHDYVTRGGSKSPERPVVKLEPISAEAATEALAKTTD
ncbi:flp protein [Hyaloraphidium curvatum]|nr:flp protein [Hyaloraphidium curvatum]